MHANEQWYIKGNKGDYKSLAARIGVSRRLASLLLLRLQSCGSPEAGGDRGAGDNIDAAADVDAIVEFLNPDIGRMYDEMLLKDMDRALGVIKEAVGAQKKTLVIGDYDVDGIMGLLILDRVLKRVLGNVSHCIPHRVDDGYGINDNIVNSAHRDGVELIITCDNGMSAHGSIALAKSLGMDIIVTDHHDVPSEETGAGEGGCGVPPADAVINPKRPDCAYPFKDLCGAMVAYKFASALAKDMAIELADVERDEMLCCAALATICDIVSLVDENRRVVYHGLKLLNAGVRNPGLAELIGACGLAGKFLTTYEVGHILGPCINAAGRLDSAELSYNLFSQDDPAAARTIASEMIELNRRRQDLTARAYESAVGIIGREGLSGDRVIVLCAPETHESICGIVAGKLKDKYARPVIVLTGSASGLLKGSGRSVEGYDLLGCVKAAAGLLDKYGGHKMAVGISVSEANLALLRDTLNRECDIDFDMLVPKERIDMCLDADDITMELIGDVSRLEPFGRGNEKPVFALRGMALEYAALIGSRRNVVKIKMRQGAAHQGDRPAPHAKPLIEAVFFGDVGLFMQKLGLAAGGDGSLICRGAPAVDADVTFFP